MSKLNKNNKETLQKDEQTNTNTKTALFEEDDYFEEFENIGIYFSN